MTDLIPAPPPSFLAAAVPSSQEKVAFFEEALKGFSRITTLEIFAFLIPFVLAIIIDLCQHRKSHKPIAMKDAAFWSVIWVLCSLVFGVFIWKERNFESASAYFTGYVLEKALALDNLFAFYLIFKSFGLTLTENQHHQHRILYWGILGAIIFRVVFLGAGAFIVNLSPFVLILFAVIVLWTVLKMWKSGDEDEEVDYTNHWSVVAVRKFAKTNPSIESGRFFFHGVTPLFLCLICIEVCDVIFAFDSMPVIVAVVRDPYLMITSSLWAAAGLRSLYFLLIAAQRRFWALDKAVMILLIYVSIKLIYSGLAGYFGWTWHIPHSFSLAVVAIILSTGVIYSLAVKEPDSEDKDDRSDGPRGDGSEASLSLEKSPE